MGVFLSNLSGWPLLIVLYSGKNESAGFGVRQVGVQNLVLPLGHWTSDLTSLSLSFPIF